MSHGTRKVNEYIMTEGRALILTEELAEGISKHQWDGISDGTIYVNPETGDLKYKKRNSKIKKWTNFAPANLFSKKSITGDLIADKTIEGRSYSDYSINNLALANECVNSRTVALGSLEEKNMKALSFTGNIFKDNSISGQKIIDKTLNGSSLIDRTIDGLKIKERTLSNLEIKEKSLSEDCYGDNSISERVFAPMSVSNRAIALNAINSENICNEAILSSKLGKKAVKEDNMDDNSVSSRVLIDLSVTENKYDNCSIGTDKYKDNSITGSKIALNTIRNINIEKNTIQQESLSEGIREVLQKAVVHKNGTARVYGKLQVDGNIEATNNDCSQEIVGFKVFNPVFRDYAEGFMSTDDLEPGDIVEIDDGDCVKKADKHSNKIVGVVSDEYAFCLGATPNELRYKEKYAIGLLGRVKVKVLGPTKPGDFIVSIGNGVGVAISNTDHKFTGCIIGKALETKTTTKAKKITCLIQAM